MTWRFTIVGCGTSGGVPRPGVGWGACDPANPKNRRRRCALLVEKTGEAGITRILVDIGPDLREQLLAADVDRLDAVFVTHEHADHTHGIDDLRGLFIHNRKRIDIYFDIATERMMRERFHYCFETPPGSEYPPIANGHRIAAGKAVTIVGPGGEIEVLPFLQRHGDIDSLGFRFGALAYSSDLSDVPAQSLPALAGLDVWIVDALRYAAHPSHFSLEDAIGWIERIKPRRAVLTDMHSDLDYDKLRETLPSHIEPAYDGLRIKLPVR